MLERAHHITQEDQLDELAKQLAQECVAGDVILLEGELGSGKTTFTQHVAKALGVVGVVTSPTFTIMGEYAVTAHPDIEWLVHIDLYRIPEDQHGIDFAYITEVIETAKDNKRLVFIEWPERLGLTLDKAAWHISFEYGNQKTERIITIQKG